MTSDNLFQSPAETTAATIEAPRVGIGRMYSKGGVLWAGLFGSFLAGGYVMSLNYRRAGLHAQASTTVLISLIATVLFFVLAMFLPDRIPNAVFTLMTLVPLNFIYDYWQGDLFSKHMRAKGERGSNWACVGIGLIGLLIILATVFGGAYTLGMLGFIKD